MKFYDTHFEEYIESNKRISLHPKLSDLYKTLPQCVSKLKNMIFYGPKGVGKYTQVLSSIKKYSASELKYEKKMTITYNKNTYYFKISDIHFEIDMSLLGCNSKMLWNEVYNQIIDVILAKTEKNGIIVCKNFQDIHSDLLDSFYSYMQTLNNKLLNLKFIIISEEISFIPDNIVNCCKLISVPRPSRTLYNKCVGNKIKNFIELDKITNIKNITASVTQLMNPHEVICTKILDSILNNENFNFLLIRDQIYDIFIYNLDVTDCIWFLLNKLIKMKKIKENDIVDVLIQTYTCLRYYNNNYRPIYHLESYVFYLIKKIYEF